jgi:hypothetical protein
VVYFQKQFMDSWDLNWKTLGKKEIPSPADSRRYAPLSRMGAAGLHISATTPAPVCKKNAAAFGNINLFANTHAPYVYATRTRVMTRNFSEIYPNAVNLLQGERFFYFLSFQKQ